MIRATEVTWLAAPVTSIGIFHRPERWAGDPGAGPRHGSGEPDPDPIDRAERHHPDLIMGHRHQPTTAQRRPRRPRTRHRRRSTPSAPPSPPAFIGAAYWFTSSTSFANPAVTIGRAFTDTFAGIAPGSAPPFLIAQLLGGVVGLGLVALVFGRPAPDADNVVVPHSDEQLATPAR